MFVHISPQENITQNAELLMYWIGWIWNKKSGLWCNRWTHGFVLGNVQNFNLSSIITFVSRIEDIVSQLQTNGRLSEQIKFSRPNLVWHYFVVRVTTMFSCLASLKEYRWRNPFEMPQDDTIFISLTLVHSINSSQFNFDRNWFI